MVNHEKKHATHHRDSGFKFYIINNNMRLRSRGIGLVTNIEKHGG